MKKLNDLKDVIGLTLDKVTGGNIGDDEIVFLFSTGEEVTFYHAQDCCESVRIADIDGDIQDLIGGIVTEFEEVGSEHGGEHGDETYTWTFYKFATTKGFVNVRWLGESNGYYSEGVDFIFRGA